MSENQYGFKYDEYGNTREIIVYTSGVETASLSFVNKGTAFNETERRILGLQGVFPPSVRTIENQIYNSQRIINNKVDDLEKYIFLRAMFDRNVTLAHALIHSDVEQYMGIIYTPTVGTAVKKYSSMFRRPNGLHFFPDNIDQAEDILRRYLHRDIRVAVVTDNEGILGIGDQGAGGIAISLGKLMLYTQGAGIAPWHCLPVSLDVGTDNQELLNDPLYLGWHHERLQGEEYLSFVGRFARAFRNVFPNALCQWEDFSDRNAFAIRDAFADELISFNDDIQGTGAIALAAIYSAMKIKSEAIDDQIFLVCGSGARGIGIAEQIELGLRDKGLSLDKARERIFVYENNGVISTAHRSEHYKMKYAKKPAHYSWIKSGETHALAEIIKRAGATVLIGACGESGCFTQEIVEAALENCSRPVILPLSGMDRQAEEAPGDIEKWSGGKAIIVGGSNCVQGGRTEIAPCNNVLIFPGVALGTLASGSRQILPRFFTEAAKAVSAGVTPGELANGILVPPVARFGTVSRHVAHRVAMCAVAEGQSRPCAFSDYQHENDETRMKRLIDGMCWKPEYLPLIAM